MNLSTNSGRPVKLWRTMGCSSSLRYVSYQLAATARSRMGKGSSQRCSHLGHIFWATSAVSALTRNKKLRTNNQIDIQHQKISETIRQNGRTFPANSRFHTADTQTAKETSPASADTRHLLSFCFCCGCLSSLPATSQERCVFLHDLGPGYVEWQSHHRESACSSLSISFWALTLMGSDKSNMTVRLYWSRWLLMDETTRHILSFHLCRPR